MRGHDMQRRVKTARCPGTGYAEGYHLHQALPVVVALPQLLSTVGGICINTGPGGAERVYRRRICGDRQFLQLRIHGHGNDVQPGSSSTPRATVAGRDNREFR
jgi:hypothetical protein